MALGSPSTHGLYKVKGNLTLAGRLNINDMGGFGPGLYRLFNYDGTLIDKGLKRHGAGWQLVGVGHIHSDGGEQAGQPDQ